ncbi:MAG: hypothetical protein OEV80_15310, partial [candidate division Zixibacteria bacterium]|nr:hypothetical protein [candidate division Zixibacteria bacterium]
MGSNRRIALRVIFTFCVISIGYGTVRGVHQSSGAHAKLDQSIQISSPATLDTDRMTLTGYPELQKN